MTNTPTPPTVKHPPEAAWPAFAPGKQAYKWLHTLTWVLIYGGVLGVIAGFATGDQSKVWGYSLAAVGACATVAGIVLVYIRTRLPDRGA
jgi:hypothetical protein